MSRKLILDTNLLVLLVVGLVRPDFISQHKRLKAFDKKDFNSLSAIIAQYDELTFIPHVYTETSNLLGYKVNEPLRSELYTTLKKIIDQHGENPLTSRAAAERAEYLFLGLTDSALLELMNDKTSLLTTDVKLYLAAQKNGLTAFNYNHIRDQRPDFQ